MDGKTDGRIGHLAGIALLTLVLLWPALWSGAPTAYMDSQNYYGGGGEAVEFFLERTGLDGLFGPEEGGSDAGAEAAPAGDAAGAAGGPNSVRSVPYSVFLNVAMRAVDPMAAVVPMALVTAWLIWLMMAPLRPSLRLAGGVVTALATTLPFYTSQIMPDLQASWLIAIPIVVMLRDGAVGWPLATALIAAAVAAILFHYSHIPLAMATGTVLGLWFGLRRRYGAALLAQVPLVLAVAINVGMSLVISQADGGGATASGEGTSAPDEAVSNVSIAPGRLPIVLARLLEDGVAQRYLYDTCPENGFAICEVYEVFPKNHREALFGPNHIRRRATPEQMQRITAEEMDLAWEVIRYDPWAQVQATVGNTVEQLLRAGLGGMSFATYEIMSPQKIDIDLQRLPRGLFSGLQTLLAISSGLASLALLVLAWRMPAARAPIVLLALGLLANAFVCGALSAPAGRYQGRVVWLVVALAMALGLSRLETSRQDRRRFTGPTAAAGRARPAPRAG